MRVRSSSIARGLHRHRVCMSSTGTPVHQLSSLRVRHTIDVPSCGKSTHQSFFDSLSQRVDGSLLPHTLFSSFTLFPCVVLCLVVRRPPTLSSSINSSSSSSNSPFTPYCNPANKNPRSKQPKHPPYHNTPTPQQCSSPTSSPTPWPSPPPPPWSQRSTTGTQSSKSTPSAKSQPTAPRRPERQQSGWASATAATSTTAATGARVSWTRAPSSTSASRPRTVATG
jgi:hypothetical protein